MANSEENQYTVFCKDRFNHLDNKLDKIFTILEGNGAAGIKGRLGKMESAVTVIEGRWKWIFGILAAITAAIIISYLRK